MSEEIVDTSNQEAEQSQQESTPQLSPDEEKAIARGWVPKEEWVEAGNKEEDWKPAKVFNEHGEMIGKIRGYERKTAELERAVQFMHQKSQEVYESGYQAALKSLRQEKREALAEGDLVKADEIDEKIDETRSKLEQTRRTPPPQPQAAVDPEFEAWRNANPWYNDGVMQKFADALAIEYINVNKGQVTAADVRDFVEKEVKKEFAHKFKQTPRSAPSPDGDGKGPSGKTGGGKLDSRLAQAKAEMTDEERGIMKTMIRSTGMTEQEYLKMYLS